VDIAKSYDKGGKMKLEEVLPALRAGKKIRRAAWGDLSTRLKDDNAIIMLEYKGKWLDTPDAIGALTMNDILSNDWEVVE
jgi:hypothetical protein